MGCACCKGSAVEQPVERGEDIAPPTEPRREASLQEAPAAVVAVQEAPPEDDARKDSMDLPGLDATGEEQWDATLGEDEGPNTGDKGEGEGKEKVKEVREEKDDEMVVVVEEEKLVVVEEREVGPPHEVCDADEVARMIAAMEEARQVAKEEEEERERRMKEEEERERERAEAVRIEAEAADARRREEGEERRRRREEEEEAERIAADEARRRDEEEEEEERRRLAEEEDLDFGRASSSSVPSSCPVDMHLLMGHIAANVLDTCVGEASAAAGSVLALADGPDYDQQSDMMGAWDNLGMTKKHKAKKEDGHVSEIESRKMIRRQSMLIMGESCNQSDRQVSRSGGGREEGKENDDDHRPHFEKITPDNMVEWAKDLVVQSILSAVKSPKILSHRPTPDGIWRRADHYAMLGRMTMLRAALAVAASLRNAAVPPATSLMSLASIPRGVAMSLVPRHVFATAEHRPSPSYPFGWRAATVARGQTARGAAAYAAAAAPSWGYSPQTALLATKVAPAPVKVHYYMPKSGVASPVYSSAAAAAASGRGPGGGGSVPGGGYFQFADLPARRDAVRPATGVVHPAQAGGGCLGGAAAELTRGDIGLRGGRAKAVEKENPAADKVLALGGSRSRAAAMKLVMLPVKVQTTRGKSASLLSRLMIN